MSGNYFYQINGQLCIMGTNTEDCTLKALLEPYSKYFKEKVTLDFVESMFRSYKVKIDALAMNEKELDKLISENTDLKRQLAEMENIHQIVEVFKTEDIASENTSFFKEIVFLGARKSDKIILNREGIRLIGAMFRGLTGEKEKDNTRLLVNLSTELFHEWSKFKLFRSLYFKDAEIKRRYTLSKKNAILLEIKKNLSNEIHSFLKYATTISKSGQISEEEIRLIGTFFLWGGLCHQEEFLINEDFAKVRLWIKRAFVHLKATKKIE
jgi:hypothetical protein